MINPGNPNASTMHDAALQAVIDDPTMTSHDSIKRLARSHQNANAKIVRSAARIVQLERDLNEAHLRISRAMVALSP